MFDHDDVEFVYKLNNDSLLLGKSFPMEAQSLKLGP